MKNNYLHFAISAIALSCISLIGHAQGDTKKAIEFASFTGIEAEGSCEIHISKGETYDAELNVPKDIENYVQVYVKGGNLCVSLDTKNMDPEVKKVYKKQDSRIPLFKVYVTMPTVKSIKVTDDVQVYAENAQVNASKFDLSASGQSKVSGLYLTSKEATLELSKKASVKASFSGNELLTNTENNSVLEIVAENVKTVTTKLAGSSKVTLTGTMSKLEVKSSGSSELNASAADPSNVSLSMDGSSTVYVYTKGELSIEMKGANLYYKGKPSIDIVAVKNASINKFDTYPAK